MIVTIWNSYFKVSHKTETFVKLDEQLWLGIVQNYDSYKKVPVDAGAAGLFASQVEVIKSSLRDVGDEIGRSKASTAVAAVN